MKNPFSYDNEKSPRWGVLSPVDVEMYDPVGDWYYFGRVEMLKKDISKEKGTIFFYRLQTKYREDEKVVVSTQDLVQIADQIPYTRTKKGKDRLFQIFMLTFLGIYGLTLWFMSLMIQAGPSIVFYSRQVSGLELDVATVGVMFASVAGSWAWTARYHHLVSDWEIQPLRINSLKSSVDFYILTNSSKAPVFEEVLRLARIDSSSADAMITAVRLFQKEEIDRLQDTNEFLEDQLQVTHVAAFGAKQTSLESSLMTRTERVRDRQDKTKQYFVVAAAVALTFIAAFFIFSVG